MEIQLPMARRKVHPCDEPGAADADSRIFSVTIATYPFAVNRNPTPATDASCDLDELAPMAPRRSPRSPDRFAGLPAGTRPSVGCRTVDYECNRATSGRCNPSTVDRAGGAL